MAYLDGQAIDIEIETNTPGTFVPINGVSTFRKNANRPTNNYPIFMSSVQLQTTGTKEETYSMSGYFDPTDAGQVRLFGHANGNTIGKLRILYDGTDGWTQDFKIGTQSYEPEPDGLQPWSADLTATSAQVAVGSGILL